MASDARYSDPHAQAAYSDSQYAQSTGKTYVAPPAHDQGFLANASTEKMVDDGVPLQTQRAQPGRQGLPNHSKSWAEVGPPPRSTGILRMWRKDERGQQWFKVGPSRRSGIDIVKGGGLRSTFRVLCCCLTITLITIVSILLSIVLVSSDSCYRLLIAVCPTTERFPQQGQHWIISRVLDDVRIDRQLRPEYHVSHR